ncbi:MAG: hypothetical protein F4151_12215 [Gammaproteobacteria bacterium]|nr:hypothetical protein [Gammaproteobacteria bacterium]
MFERDGVLFETSGATRDDAGVVQATYLNRDPAIQREIWRDIPVGLEYDRLEAFMLQVPTRNGFLRLHVS